jgi:hypothetical protein
MSIEPTIIHSAGAGLQASHDAAVVFLDHQGARVRFLDGIDLASVTAAHIDLGELHDTFRVHDKSFAGGFGRAKPDDTPLFGALAQVCLRCKRVLVVGPGSAKSEFVKYLSRNNPDALARHVIGVETVDHPTDGQLVARARAAFAEAAERDRTWQPVRSVQSASALSALRRE